MRSSRRKPDLGLLLSAVAALLLFFLMFQDWYGISAAAPAGEGAISVGTERAWNAWISFAWIDLVLLLLVAVAVIAAVLNLTGNELRIRSGAVLTALGGFAFLLVFWRLVFLPWEGADRHAALVWSLFAIAAVVAGGVLSVRSQSAAPGRRPAAKRQREKRMDGR